ncbi:MAG: ABC transporter permease [Deltaproteobacteria bacterium]|nr:ABC transporter permease [Deltaproteobacteria bacterium]
MVGLAIVGAFVLMSLVGPSLVQDASAFVATPHQPPSAAHWFGTTGQGQDVFAQTVVGARLTLAVGFTCGFLVIGIGSVIGATAGYVGGRVDEGLSLLTNVFLVLPGLPLMVVVAAWLPAGPGTLLAVLTLTGWAWNARVLRAQTLSLRGKDFVAAAQVSGDGPLRIVMAEILPNMLSLMVSSFIGATVYAIGAQVGLEFLGLGDIGAVTWGTNLYWASNDSALLTGAWWTFVPTGACIALVGFGLTLINFAIDEIANPALQSETIWRKQLSVTPPPGAATPVEVGLA